MTFGENVRLALAGLWANKLRAILTLLGIIIGIASVVTILTISRGVTSAVTDSLGSLGGQDMYLSVDTKENIAKNKANEAQPGTEYDGSTTEEPNEDDEDMSGDSDAGSAIADGEGDDQYLTPEILDQIREEFSDQIKGISVQGMGGYGTATGTGGDEDADVQTTNQDFLIGSNMEMVAGRGFDASEIESADTVAVISDTLAKKLFGGAAQNAVGQSFEFNSDESQMTFQVIGVARQVQIKGAANALLSVGGGASGTSFYIPYTLEEEVTGTKEPGFNWATVRPIPGTDAKALKHNLQEFLDKAWADSDYGVSIDSMDSMMDEIKKVFSTIAMGLSVIAGLSLLVGGIGVMNIMLVSVTERTREIGIRKALGATQWNIRLQFLVEAMMVCLLGGLLGVALGGLAGYLGSNAMGNPAIPPLGGVLFSLAFSLGIGIFFGYYPASKAAKLDPIEALRYE